MSIEIDGQSYLSADEAMEFIDIGRDGLADSVLVGRLNPVPGPHDQSHEYFAVTECETTRQYYRYA